MLNVTTEITTTSAVLSDGLAELLGSARAAAWSVDRERYRPQVHVAYEDGRLAAAAMTSARPATAVVKIVDLWGEGLAAEAVLQSILREAIADGRTAVKWELPIDAATPRYAPDHGFVPLRPPIPSAPATKGTRGMVRWLRPIPFQEPRYYGQTTLFTCGAVAALMADDVRGGSGFAGENSNADRDLEFAFWRRASNYPACEPVGLAVAVHEYFGKPHVEVVLDATGPVLLEEYSGFEHDFRAELQEESRRRADTLGIDQSSDRISIREVGRRVGSGELALLLIDERAMHAEEGPHWIVAHAYEDGVFLIEDPWADVDRGETWVDAHLLAVNEDDLDRMASWGPDGYRGVVFVGP